MPVTWLLLLLTFRFLLAKEALGHFSKEFLGRTRGVELWHHLTAAGRKLVRSVTLEEENAESKQTKGEEDDERSRRHTSHSLWTLKRRVTKFCNSLKHDFPAPYTVILTYFGEEFMVEDLIERESVAGVFLQDARDESLCGGGKRGGQVVPNFLYTLVRLLQVESLERRAATHQRVPGQQKPRQPSVK